MKKFTQISFVFFLGIVVAIFGYGFLFNANNSLDQYIPVVQKSITTKPILKQKNVSSSTTITTTSPTNSTTPVIPTPTSASSSGFTANEVAQHSSQNDCYIIISNKVYYVTSYVDSHPGGVRRIVSGCGTDATSSFTSIHNQSAWNILAKFYIGDLK